METALEFAMHLRFYIRIESLIYIPTTMIVYLSFWTYDDEKRKCMKFSKRCMFLDAVIAIPPEHDHPAKLYPSLGPNVISKEYTPTKTITLISTRMFIYIMLNERNSLILLSLFYAIRYYRKELYFQIS